MGPAASRTYRPFHGRRLWPVHAVHHSGPDPDWLSVLRFHPVNDILSRVAQAVPLVLLGFAPAAVVCVIPVVVAFIVVTHANVAWTWGPLRLVFVSPVYRQRHHSTDPAAVDTNFAGVFVLWDRLYDLRGRAPAAAYSVEWGCSVRITFTAYPTTVGPAGPNLKTGY